MTTETPVLSNVLKQPRAVHSFRIYIIVFTAYIILSSLMELLPDKPEIQLIVMFIPPVGLIILPVFIYSYLKRFNIKETFYLRIPRLSVYLMSILVIISGLIIVGAINSLLTPLFKPYELPIKELEQHFVLLANYNIYWLLLGTTLTPAICEELLFRGFILRGFINSVGKTKALIITALLFGIMHFILPRIIMTALLGMLFGVLLILTNSIIIPITGHFINNAMAILILLKHKEAEIPIYIIIIAIPIFVGGLYWLVRNKPRNPVVNPVRTPP